MASFDSTLIARAATALYDTQIGHGTMQEALDWINVADRDVDALANTLFVRDFGTWTDAAVATQIVNNVGITGAAAVAEAVGVVTGVLAATDDDEKGAAINSLLNAFAGLTANPVFGPAATAFNTQVRAAVAYAQDLDSTDVSLSSTTGMVFNLDGLDAAGADVMRLTGDQDVRIDFTNHANQVVGLDLDGDGLIEFNGSERSITGEAADFEIVDAYSRNPLNHTDTANNFLGDIYFDGTSFAGADADGTKTDGNIFLGGLGADTALGGVGNDFLAGGAIAQGHGGEDKLYGGRNADFFFAEFSMLDAEEVDGNGHGVLYVDGGNTSDDQPAGKLQSDQDHDWLLLEGSDDDEPLLVELTEGDGQGVDENGAIDVQSRNGQHMDIEDVENLDASGNLYGFLDDMDVEIGGRAIDDRDADQVAGSTNYGLGSSAQLDIDGSEVANIIIAGYDNDFIAGDGGNDLLMGGNLQQLFETVAGGVTNPNLASITLDGLDNLHGGTGSDGLVFEADGGVYLGDVWADDGDSVIEGGEVADDGTDTLWLTNYALGTNTAAASTTDGRLRFDLGSQTDLTDTDADAEPGFAGYGGADRALTADQTNYVATANVKSTTVISMNILDASGLSTGVRGLDYFSAGTNAATDLTFSNRQDFSGYAGDMDLRGALNQDNNIYANAGQDVIEGRGGSDAAAESATTYDLTLQGGDGNDDFYFSLDGDDGGDETNIVRRKVDANSDGFWDGSDAKGTIGTWGQDFGQGTTELGDSVLTVDINLIGAGGSSDVELNVAVNFVSEIITGVELADGSFLPISLNGAGIRAATTYAELADAINDEIAAEYVDEADHIVATADGFRILITDTESRTLADDVSQVPGAGVTVNQKANTTTQNIFVFGPPEETITQDRIIFKSYEDRSDNEGVDDDAITGSEVSLGEDAYAEDLVVNFAADGTRIAEDQEYVITFRNLTTQDTVSISVNGVIYTLEVGVAVNGSLIDGEDTRHTALETVQTNFLARFADFIDSFMDDDTAAGQVAAASTATTLTLTQVAYHDGEETVYMTTPVVTLTNGSGGERPTVTTVDNDAQTEVFLFNFDGRDNKLNVENVLFWGQESVQRSTLETALTAGDEITGSEALVIDGGHGAGDDDLDDENGDDIPHNLATDDGEIDWDAVTEFQVENFAAHGDDYLIGGAGDDTIEGRTGDDRVRGSLGNDALDGGKDWYAVLESGDSDYHLEYLNAFEASDRDTDGEVLDIQLVLQTESGHSLLEPRDDSPEETYEAYFDDTLVYHQADFTVGVTRFTITLDNYAGEGEDIEFDEGGAGTVGVDANGDGTVEVENVSTFTEFENIRTQSGTGAAVAGAGGGQGRDTLNVQALSDDADVGVLYDLTGSEGADNLTEPSAPDDNNMVVASRAGDVVLLEDLDFVDLNDDDEDDEFIDSFRQMIKVDGVENVIFGDGNDVLLIDETEAAKDNDITGDDGADEIVYLNDFPDEDEEGDDEPTVTINVGNAHVAGSSGSLDLVEMTEGRVGSVVATDTLRGMEEITLGGNTAAGPREDDVLNVENLSAGASVSYVTGEVFSDTDGDLDFEDGVLQLTVNNLFEVEFVVADGEDAVIVADSDIMSLNTRTDEDGDEENLTINSFLNYDLLDERDDLPTRLTIADLRAIDAGTDDTADEDDIPEGYNFAQFVFSLGQDTDTVDYSQTTDAINAIIDLALDEDPQYIMVDSDGGDFDGVDGDNADRVDALLNVEQVVASQGESVLDFTASDIDVEITFQYLIDADVVLDADDGYSETNAVRIADGNGDTIEGLTSFIERYTADDGDVTNATWSRIEGSDFDETVIYEGSENLVDQSDVDHRFSDDELNLRGGDNTVSYSPLETSITATISVDEYDPLDPTADQIDVTIEFQDGDGGDLNGNEHHITSYAADNELHAGSLKLEASQDAEDTVIFEGDTSKLLVVGQSPGVLTVEIGDAGAMVLTGFEFVQDSDGDDTYDFRDLSNIDGDIEFIDSDVDTGAGETTADRDTIKVYDDAIGFDSAPADTISLEVLNDIFRMDFDVLDVTGVTDGDLLLVGDDDDHDDDAVLNEDDADYDDDFGYFADYDRDGETDARDTVDDVVVGDLDLIDDITLFTTLWLTDASIDSGGDTFELDTDLGEFNDGTGDLFFTYDGLALNFSLVTDTDVTVDITGGADVSVVGSAGDDIISGAGGNDTIEGGDGADDLDGGVIAPVGARLVQSLAAVGFASGTEAGGAQVFNLVSVITNLFADPSPEVADAFDYVEGADIDVIGATWAGLSLATWSAAFEASGLTTVEAGALSAVTYDSLLNELSFDFANNAAGSTITDADLLAVSLLGSVGDAVLTGGESATGFVDAVESADNFVYDEGDSTETAMDEIFNFSVDNGGGVDDTIDLSAFADLSGHDFTQINNAGSGFANFAAIKAAAIASALGDDTPFIGSDGTDTWVFIDDDHSFSLDAGETVIKLVGIDATGIDLDNFVQP